MVACRCCYRQRNFIFPVPTPRIETNRIDCCVKNILKTGWVRGTSLCQNSIGLSLRHHYSLRYPVSHLDKMGKQYGVDRRINGQKVRKDSGGGS